MEVAVEGHQTSSAEVEAAVVAVVVVVVEFWLSQYSEIASPVYQAPACMLAALLYPAESSRCFPPPILPAH